MHNITLSIFTAVLLMTTGCLYETGSVTDLYKSTTDEDFCNFSKDMILAALLLDSSAANKISNFEWGMLYYDYYEDCINKKL